MACRRETMVEEDGHLGIEAGLSCDVMHDINPPAHIKWELVNRTRFPLFLH